MSVLFLLLGASLLVALLFLGGFLWSVRKGQYEDTETPAMRMLLDGPKTKRHHSSASPHGEPPRS